MTMSGYLLCSLLLLCPPLAMAATPEQELHAEAQKLFPTIFTKCGDDHFSKHKLDYRYGEAYIIGQYKDLAARIQIYPPSKFQIPPDLVVKSQAIDITEVI
jgi:hypothetical protein